MQVQKITTNKKIVNRVNWSTEKKRKRKGEKREKNGLGEVGGSDCCEGTS